MKHNKLPAVLLRFILIVAGFLTTYFLLTWFHRSWYTGEPVLNILAPFISAAVSIGNWCALFLQKKYLITSILAIPLITAFTCGAFQKKYFHLLITGTFGILVFAQLQLLNGNVKIYYLLCLSAFIVSLVLFFFQKKFSTSQNVPDYSWQISWLSLTLIISLAILLRFYLLDSVPPGIYDEAAGMAVLLKN